MEVFKDFQGLINWCTQPHPNQMPRLRRVAGLHLEQWMDNGWPGYDPEDPILESEWNGTLIYTPKVQRQIRGVFAGTVSGVINPNHLLQVWLTIAEEDAWIGIQGQDIGNEWREDVHIFDYFMHWDGLGANAIFRILGTKFNFSLSLRPTYLYGG
jgi:hypothetical protein